MNLVKKLGAENLYLVGLLGVVVGLPLSKVVISVSMFFLVGVWLIEGAWLDKLKRLKSSPYFWIFSAVFFIHVVGLLYTQNFDYAFNDIRIKLPLIIIPFVLLSIPSLSEKRLEWLLNAFTVAVFIKTCMSIYNMKFVFSKEIIDIRLITGSLSHIRLSLMVCLSIAIQVYYLFASKTLRLPRVATILWLLSFLLLLKSLTGFMVLTALYLFFIAYLLFVKRKLLISLVLLATISILAFLTINTVRKQVNEFYTVRDTFDINKIDSVTIYGNKYDHDYQHMQFENGHYVGLFICWKELEEAWSTRSKLPFMALDKKGNQIRFTIVRYLTSKGLRKDKEGLSKLTLYDINNIENGISNYLFEDVSTIKAKVQSVIWEWNEWKQGRESSGHTLVQRIEFWETALFIFKENPIIGVGTGDVQDAFNEAYIKNNSSLKPEFRLRSHNQYLTFAVSFGVIGLLVFVFSLLYPVFYPIRKNKIIAWVFFLIAMLSFLTEDTLETQVGVTFFAFFNSLFCVREEESK